MRSIVGDNTQEDLWIHENAVEECVTHIVVIGKQGCSRAAIILSPTTMSSCDNPNTDKDALMIRE